MSGKGRRAFAQLRLKSTKQGKGGIQRLQIYFNSRGASTSHLSSNKGGGVLQGGKGGGIEMVWSVKGGT